MAVFCSTQCTTNTAVRLAYLPCPLCPEVPTQPPPEQGPITATFGAPPSVNSLDPQNPEYLLVGTGIPAEHASVSTDTVIELFLVPIIAGVDAAGPPDGIHYVVDLGPGQSLGMAFGVTLQAPFKITDLYDVTLTVVHGSDTATLQLVRDPATASGYRWTDGADYNIVDSVGNAMQTTVQNVTRPSYLVDGGLLPPEAATLGQTGWFMVASPRYGDGEEVSLAITVMTT